MGSKRKSKTPINDSIKDLLKKEIRDINNEDPDNDEEINPEEYAHARQLSEDAKDHEVLSNLLSSFPSTEGFYGKLYYKGSNGKLVFKHFLDMLEEIEDAELEILNLIKERGWEDGEYVLRVFKRGQPECKQTISWSMAASSKVSPSINKDANVTEKLAEMTGILNAVKDITGPGSAMSPNDTAKFLSEAFKSGIDTVKNSLPAHTDSNDNLNKTIETLKNLGLLKTEEKNDSMSNIVSIITILKELGVIGQQQKQADPWLEIMKYKEMGLIKFASEGSEDTLGQVEKLKSLIEVVTSLTGAGGLTGEKPSLGIELVKTLGPQVPKIVENITNTINKVVDVSKLKMAQRLGGVPQQFSPAQPPIAGASPASEITNNETIKKEESELPMRNPIVQEIYDAAQSNNQEYFTKLRDLINIYIGGNALEKLAVGEITIINFLQTMNASLKETFFTEPVTADYFNKFIQWHMQDIRKDIVVGVCEQCQEEYDYLNRDEWNKDTKRCECGGSIIESIPTNSVGHA